MGVSIAHRLGHSAVFSQPVGLDDGLPVPRLLLCPEDSTEKSVTEGTPPAFISAFLPEFPHHKFPGQDHFQVIWITAQDRLVEVIFKADVAV